MNPTPSEKPPTVPVVPKEGWHVLHLFYRIDPTRWSELTPGDQLNARTHLTRLIQEIRATEKTQLLTFAMVTPKADLGFMLLTADLQQANAFEKRLTGSLGPDVLDPVFTYLSMTEWTEYVTTREEYAAKVSREKGIAEGTPEMEKELAAFDEHQKKYYQDRLYPNMPDWPVFCFYPMNKLRSDGNNWYILPFEQRRTLMSGHAATGRRYAGRVRQLITGSTGLDDWEWGVSLFAHNTSDIKSIVYEMRFDEVSARYGEFGPFFIGLQLPVDEILRRVLPDSGSGKLH